MKLTYYKDGAKRAIKRSNRDVRFLTRVENEYTRIAIRAEVDIELALAVKSVDFDVNFADLYFLNGYQSWTDTKEFALRTRLRNIHKSPHLVVKKFGMDRYGDSSFYSYSIRRSHGYDVFYSKGKQECFLYNLNYKNAYLVIELIKDRRNLYLTSMVEGIKLKAGEEFVLFEYRFFEDFQKGLESFQNEFKVPEREKIFGYTSWYNYYQNITEEIILNDLKGLDSRFNVFQIDDGYETYVGDWLDVDPKKFPRGLKPIVEEIHAKGYKTGLWLAPFAAEKESKLVKEHPEWLKKDRHGKPVFAGGNWSGFYSLDFENPEAMAYVRRCLEHYMEMGFDFFKLDFLYCIALEPYKGKSRCQVQDAAYQFLRDVLKDKLILGCGANIINSYGKFDYLRVGPDVSLSFDDVAYMKLFHRERPSTKVTLQNTIYRSFMDGHLFYNDPDVFLLRDENLSLSFEQRVALTKINALFGSVLMTSDNLASYDEAKKKILAEALDLFQHAEFASYKRRGNLIDIGYSLNGETHELTYDTNKGVFTNER